MAVVVCPRGDHEYEDTKYTSCPYCRQVDYTPQPMLRTATGGAGSHGSAVPPTVGMGQESAAAGAGARETTVAHDRQRSPMEGKTVAIGVGIAAGEDPFNPVVGWLVVLSDKQRGRDYRVRSGWNSIGRDPECNIHLDFDSNVSRGKHAHVVFDAESNEFFVKHSDGTNVTRLNGKMVGDLTPIKWGDTIRVGVTDLLFVPLCGDKFSWTGGLAAASGEENAGN